VRELQGDDGKLPVTKVDQEKVFLGVIFTQGNLDI